MNPQEWNNTVLQFQKDAQHMVYKAMLYEPATPAGQAAKDLMLHQIQEDDIIQEDLYWEYSEYNFENENQQAFLDAGHFYGIG